MKGHRPTPQGCSLRSRRRWGLLLDSEMVLQVWARRFQDCARNLFSLLAEALVLRAALQSAE